MALPTTITGAVPTYTGFGRVEFESSGGNTYVVMASSSTQIAVYKATDPTSSFTAQDTGNAPAAATTALAWIDAYQVSDVLHIVSCTYDNTGMTPLMAYLYHTFDMSSDSWGTTDEAITGSIDIPTAIGYARGFIMVRSTGDILVFGQDSAVANMGTDYDHVSYWLKPSGGSWGSAVAVDNGGTIRWIGPLGVMGDDRGHFIFAEDASPYGIYCRTLDTSNSLDTFPSSFVSSWQGTGVVPAVYDNSGTDHIVFCYGAGSNPSYVAYFDSADTPSISTVQQSDGRLYSPNGALMGACAANGTDVHVVSSYVSNQDLYHDVSTNGGSSWGTDDQPFNITTATINNVSANVYSRGGNTVLAVVVDDGGTIKYDEYTLSAGGLSAAVSSALNIIRAPAVTRTAGAVSRAISSAFLIAVAASAQPAVAAQYASVGPADAMTWAPTVNYAATASVTTAPAPLLAHPPPITATPGTATRTTIPADAVVWAPAVSVSGTTSRALNPSDFLAHAPTVTASAGTAPRSAGVADAVAWAPAVSAAAGTATRATVPADLVAWAPAVAVTATASRATDSPVFLAHAPGVITTGAEFDATLYPTLVGWWDPSKLTGLSDGDAVSDLPDQSATGADMAPISGGTGPQYDDTEFHGIGCLRYSGAAAERLTVTNAALNAGEVTVFAVSYIYLWENTQHWVLNKQATNPATIGLMRSLSNSYHWYADIRLSGSEGTARELVSDRRGWPGVLVHEVVYDGSTMTYRINGNVIDTLSISGALDTTSGPLIIGGHPSSTGYVWNGWIGDVAYYSSALSGQERDQIVNDLLHKWDANRITTPDSGNPIFTAADCGIAGTTEVRSPKAVLDGSTYYTFFTRRQTGTWAGASYATSDVSDPWNLTASNTLVVGTGYDCAGISAAKSGSTWYVFVDDFSSGGIRQFTGTNLASLVDQGIVLSGSGTPGAPDEYVRLPSNPLLVGSTWYMAVDCRADDPALGAGSIYLYSSSDLTNWTQVGQIIDHSSNNDWEQDQAGGPDLCKLGETYWIAYQGYSTDMGADYPHHVGLASSKDLVTWTKHNQNPVIWNIPGSWIELATDTPGVVPYNGALHLLVQGMDTAYPQGDIGHWETAIFQSLVVPSCVLYAPDATAASTGSTVVIGAADSLAYAPTVTVATTASRSVDPATGLAWAPAVVVTATASRTVGASEAAIAAPTATATATASAAIGSASLTPYAPTASASAGSVTRAASAASLAVAAPSVTASASTSESVGTATFVAWAPTAAGSAGAASRAVTPADAVTFAPAATAAPGTATRSTSPGSVAAWAPTVTATTGGTSTATSPASAVLAAPSVSASPGAATRSTAAASVALAAPPATASSGATYESVGAASALLAAPSVTATATASRSTTPAGLTAYAPTATASAGSVQKAVGTGSLVTWAPTVAASTAGYTATTPAVVAVHAPSVAVSTGTVSRAAAPADAVIVAPAATATSAELVAVGSVAALTHAPPVTVSAGTVSRAASAASGVLAAPSAYAATAGYEMVGTAPFVAHAPSVSTATGSVSRSTSPAPAILWAPAATATSAELVAVGAAEAVIAAPSATASAGAATRATSSATTVLAAPSATASTSGFQAAGSAAAVVYAPQVTPSTGTVSRYAGTSSALLWAPAATTQEAAAEQVGSASSVVAAPQVTTSVGASSRGAGTAPSVIAAPSVTATTAGQAVAGSVGVTWWAPQATASAGTVSRSTTPSSALLWAPLPTAATVSAETVATAALLAWAPTATATASVQASVDVADAVVAAPAVTLSAGSVTRTANAAPLTAFAPEATGSASSSRTVGAADAVVAAPSVAYTVGAAPRYAGTAPVAIVAPAASASSASAASVGTAALVVSAPTPTVTWNYPATVGAADAVIHAPGVTTSTGSVSRQLGVAASLLHAPETRGGSFNQSVDVTVAYAVLVAPQPIGSWFRTPRRYTLVAPVDTTTTVNPVSTQTYVTILRRTRPGS